MSEDLVVVGGGSQVVTRGWAIEVFGDFRLYRDLGRVEYKVSWCGAWIPGSYASRDAAVLACGYVMGGERYGFLESARDRAFSLGRACVGVEDLFWLRAVDDGDDAQALPDRCGIEAVAGPDF